MKQCLRVQLLSAFSLMLILMMLPELSFAQSKAQTGSQPAPYPTLKSTGNPETDRLQHEKAVKQWKEAERLRNAKLPVNVKATPADNSHLREKPSAVAVKSVKAVPGQREITFVDIPGYPKFIATGNPKEDEKNYQAAKANWINENPVAYKKYLAEHRIKSDNIKRLSVTR